MRKLATLFAFVLICTWAWGQTVTVTGTVRSEKGEAIPYASVTEAGTSNGTTANGNGDFSIKIKSGSKLTISAINFAPVTLTPQSGGSNVYLKPSGDLSEVVVTALGIKRKQDVLAYSTQGIKGGDLTSTRMTDIGTSMAGKISSVQVKTQSGAKLGSASNITIRGSNNLTGIGNSPLFVVDGTPLDDINFINMDDVADVQVLKGPAASSLYGVRGANGVLMITTKKAKSNTLGVSVASTYSIDKVGYLPPYQNEYSGGTAGAGWQTYNWRATDPAEWKALDGKKYHTYFDDASWGPKMDGSEYIPWYAWIPGSKYSFKTANLTAQPNNVQDFYSTGKNAVNNISLNKAGTGYNVRVSYTNQYQTGLIPNSDLNRNFFSAQLSADVNKHFTVATNINYVNQKINGEFSDTYGNNASGSFNSWFHRDLDINKLKELQDLRTPTGRIPGWNLEDGTPGRPDANYFYNGTAYWTNPYTYYKLMSSTNIQDRLYGDVGLTYKMNDHFRITGTIRRNQRNTHYESMLPYIFEQSTEDMSSPLAINASGNFGGRPIAATYRTYDVRQVEMNYEALATYTQKFNDFNVEANAGANYRQNDYSSLDNGTKGGLVVPDLFALNNSVIQPFYYSATRNRFRGTSVFGRVSAGWKDMIMVDYTLRNDWASSLPVNSRSYLYSSIGGSFIFSKFLTPIIPAISFGKVRATWAQAGQQLDPYATSLTYAVGSNQFNSNILMTTPDKGIDSSLKAVLNTSTEFGLDLRFLNNRIGFSATYYDEKITNNLVAITIAGASGFTSKLVNSGNLRRKGVEINIDGYPVRNANFAWNVSVNLAKNTSTVESLYPGLTSLYIGGSDYSSSTGAAGYAPGIWSIPGQDWGQIRGRGIQKIDGKNVIDPATGLYRFVDNVNFGSIQPLWTGGMTNTISYKRLSLNFTIDFVQGGKFFSLSHFWGGFSGLYDFTAENNDKGKNVRDDVASGGGVHVTGVDANKNPVDMHVDAVDYYDGNGANKINEGHIFDLSYVKMREINFMYALPTKKMGSFGNFFDNLSISVFARNPFLIWRAQRFFDPSELTGNYGESGQLPPSRTFGATLKFGF